MWLKNIVESRKFDWTITVLIIINAATLGLETVPSVYEPYGKLLHLVDFALLLVFTAEILARFVVYRWQFFNDPWRLFDLVVVAIAWIPSSGGLSVLRALRILRVLRLISVVPSLKRVVGGLVAALPGMGSITALLSLVFYVFAVMATKLFGKEFPAWFGDLGDSAYTLFQIMTLESWSMGIVRPVMDVYPFAWAFFLPFILCTTFTVLNLFIGIIVAAMSDSDDERGSDLSDDHSANNSVENITNTSTNNITSENTDGHGHEDRYDILLQEIRQLRDEVRIISANGSQQFRQ